MNFKNKVAVIYQAEAAPVKNGIIKPMKDGGYSDSGADIAYSLFKQGVDVVVPVKSPAIASDLDWVFPDTKDGIQLAIDKGANIIWLNTVVYAGHPIDNFISQSMHVVGQLPSKVEIYDDKLVTNALLAKHNLPIPKHCVITAESLNAVLPILTYPSVVKPIRGRGSQGVSYVGSQKEIIPILEKAFGSEDYGDALYIEEYLNGEELTISVMPPGKYLIQGVDVKKDFFWSLPPVRRFNHVKGIAPYNGTVAVINNSEVLIEERIHDPVILELCKYCEQAADLVEAKAPIRIDCRADNAGKYFLFDLNMKPNMTGPSRPHRLDQDSLTALAARAFGWNFDDLISNILKQNWVL